MPSGAGGYLILFDINETESPDPPHSVGYFEGGIGSAIVSCGSGQTESSRARLWAANVSSNKLTIDTRGLSRCASWMDLTVLARYPTYGATILVKCQVACTFCESSSGIRGRVVMTRNASF